MSDKFLKLVEENTPGHKQESLADQFMRFAKKVSALEEGRPVSADELRLELNELDAKLEALSAPVEDQELQVDDGKVEQAQKALKAAEAITGAKDARAGMMGRDPKKNVERAVGKLYNKVAKQLNTFTKQF